MPTLADEQQQMSLGASQNHSGLLVFSGRAHSLTPHPKISGRCRAFIKRREDPAKYAEGRAGLSLQVHVFPVEHRWACRWADDPCPLGPEESSGSSDGPSTQPPSAVGWPLGWERARPPRGLQQVRSQHRVPLLYPIQGLKGIRVGELPLKPRTSL